MVIVVLEAGPAQVSEIAWKHRNPAMKSLFGLGAVIALCNLSFLRCAVGRAFRLVTNGMRRTPATPGLGYTAKWGCARTGVLHPIKIL